MKPDAFQIFCGYYLGLDRDFVAKFFNVHSLAAHYGMDSGELQDRMVEYGMPPEAMRHIDFNIAKAHGAAQDLVFSGSREELIAFARRAFDEFQVAAKGIDTSKVFEDVDYDEIFPDKPDNFGNR